jgi:hypothetical protein
LSIGLFRSGTLFACQIYSDKFDVTLLKISWLFFQAFSSYKGGKHSYVPKQLLYGTMVSVHQTIVADFSKALSRAVLLCRKV